MPVGESNRIVIDTDLELKKELHAVLKAEDKSLKHWFEDNARSYISERTQPSLFGQMESKEESK